jgi:serine/threonine protein kinase
MPHKTLHKKNKLFSRHRRKTGDEALPGYRLVAPIGRGGFGEVWKCEAPGGLLKAVKFVPRGYDFLHGSTLAEKELRAIERVKSIRHPFLLSIERIECVKDDLVIVSELADTSLYALLKEQRAAGRLGVPHGELLRYMREAAEALDVLNKHHALQHLDVKPQNLFLVGGHVKLGDFGLVQRLNAAEPNCTASRKQEAVTPLYSAPELFEATITHACDQYSLAVVYQELLTGTLPFSGSNARQLMVQHLQAEPDLRALPEQDRPSVARALHKDPQQRFVSCAAFVQALADRKHVRAASQHAIPTWTNQPAPAAAKPIPETHLETTFPCSMLHDMLHLRLDDLCRQWQGQLVHKDERDFIFHVPTPRSYWQRLLGRPSGLQVHISLGHSRIDEERPALVTVRIWPQALGRAQGAESLQVIGLLMLESARYHLQVAPRRRGQERLLWPHEFEARPILADSHLGETVCCRGIDISLSGIGFLAPGMLTASQLHLRLPPTPQTPAVEVDARVTRRQPREDGWWEMGAVLLG